MALCLFLLFMGKEPVNRTLVSNLIEGIVLEPVMIKNWVVLCMQKTIRLG